MSNNCLSVLYKHIIQVENKNMGLKVGGHKHTIAPPPQSQKWGSCLLNYPFGFKYLLSRLLDTRNRVVPIVFTKIDEIAEIKRRYDVISLLLSAL